MTEQNVLILQKNNSSNTTIHISFKFTIKDELRSCYVMQEIIFRLSTTTAQTKQINANTKQQT